MDIQSVSSQSHSTIIPDPMLDGIVDFDSLRENVTGKLNLQHWIVLPSQRTLHIFSVNKKLNGNLSIRNAICIDVDLIVKVFGENNDDMLFSLRLFSWPQLQTLIEQCGVHVKDEDDLEFVEVGNKPANSETNFCEDKEQAKDILAFGGVTTKAEDIDLHQQPLDDIIENSIFPTDHLGHSNTFVSQSYSLPETRPIDSNDGDQKYELLSCETSEAGSHQSQTCSICNESYAINDMVRHLQKHFNGNSYQCNVCGREFRNYIGLQKHAQSNHVTANEEFFCDICKVSRNFGTKENIEEHMKSRHCSAPMKPRVLICSTCGKEFFTRKQFTAHVGRHDKSKWKPCPICNKSYDNLKRHMNTKHLNIRNHICDICGSAYKQWTSLKLHMEVKHSPRQEYYCGICQDGRSFRSKDYLKRHFVKIHVKGGHRKRQTRSIKPFYECNFCDDRFSSNGSLKSHVALQHADVKLPPFPCKTCGKKFTSKNTLTEHLKLHAGQVHICHECGQSFTHKNYLNKHLVRHQKKKRKCTMCEKGYANNIDLRMHMKKVHDVIVPAGKVQKKL